MTTVERDEILDRETYEQERDRIRARVMETKARRRVHLGEHLTFLFENRETTRYQVQEMLRAEGRFDEKEIAHELSTYNELLGGPGELGCTLMIEIAEPERRDALLRAWLPLPAHLFAELEGGALAPARVDDRQVGEDRLSSVQYLKFDCEGGPPVALRCNLPGLELRLELTADQRAALAEDLGA